MQEGSNSIRPTVIMQGLYPETSEAIDCRRRMAATSNFADDDSYCGIFWDGFICWNETKAGTTAEIKCPKFLGDSPEDAVASRICDEDGNWKFYEEHNKSWTDYKSCISSMYPRAIPRDRTLQILYSVGYGLSLIALVVAIAIFLYFRKLRCPRNTIHIQFFISFIFRAIFIFIRDILQAQAVSRAESGQEVESFDQNEMVAVAQGSPVCKIVFTLTQYCLVANYYWLLVEGVYLHSLITLAVFSGRTGLRYYFALGWGCPALIVLPWTIRNIVQHEQGCWWHNVTLNPSYWIIKAPVMLSILIDLMTQLIGSCLLIGITSPGFACLVNFILFLNITRVLATKLRASNAAEARVYTKLAKSTLVLIPIFGVYYIVTVGMHASTDPTVTSVRMYVDLIISPFQGLFMATLYCFLNGDVQAEINRKWKLHKINRTLSSNRSVVPRSTAHSRSSVSTPPRKDSTEGGLENESGRASHRFSVIGRIIALRSRLFQKKTRKGQMNGSVGNHKDTTNGRPLTETTITITNTKIADEDEDVPQAEEEATEVTKLKAESLIYRTTNGEGDESKESQSDEDKLLADKDSTNHETSEKDDATLQTLEDMETKKGVHFAANIETEV